MDRERIKQIIKKRYPYVTGALLTGSQINNIEFGTNGDVDIVIIDPTFSVVSASVTTIDGVAFDFTQLPLFNLENIILNESFEYQGVIFSMISYGEILIDTDEKYILNITQFVKRIINLKTKFKSHHLSDSIHSLRRLQKHFYKDLKDFESFFLISDFLHTIGDAQLYSLNQIPNKGVYKGRLLNDLDSKFVSEVMALVKLSLKNEIQLSKLGSYISSYIDSLDNYGDSDYDTIIINLFYDNFSLENFIELIPEIKKHKILGQRFQYIYIPSGMYNYIYKYNLSVAFKLKKMIPDYEVLDSLRELIIKHRKTSVYISIYPTFHYNYKLRNEEFREKIDELFIHNCELVTSFYRPKEYIDFNKIIALAIIQLTFVSKIISLDHQLFLKLNFNLCNQYIVSYREQNEAKEPGEIIKLRNDRMEGFKSYLKEEYGWISNAFEIGQNAADEIAQYKDKIYFNSLQTLSKLVGEFDLNNTFFNDDITHEFLSKNLKVSDVESARLYINLAEYVLKSLSLNSHNSAKVLYLISSLTTKARASSLVEPNN